MLFGLQSSASERDDFIACVASEVGQGTDPSEIGGLCLEEVRPGAGESETEPYPYEKTLRSVLVEEGSFRDPESARLRDVVYSRNSNVWRGRINAPNGSGGFAGWEYFALRDRYRGSGRRSEYIDLKTGVKAFVKGTCKKYQAWNRDFW